MRSLLHVHCDWAFLLGFGVVHASRALQLHRDLGGCGGYFHRDFVVGQHFHVDFYDYLRHPLCADGNRGEKGAVQAYDPMDFLNNYADSFCHPEFHCATRFWHYWGLPDGDSCARFSRPALVHCVDLWIFLLGFTLQDAKRRHTSPCDDAVQTGKLTMKKLSWSFSLFLGFFCRCTN
ncbi:hypothetical protein Ocin01_10481 [Orchesella cincta]|uniref:Secreted protein n=1 Tax=Orchesella cincta TaxID=48709 RepID=A0A1D2MSX4_ORCCI|nr:hypothetical protein Ocin01_10481 [Orchesella cincta]